MGRTKEEMMRRWELEDEEHRTEWIREKIGNYDADETHPKWDELAADYDGHFENGMFGDDQD